jgi:methylaspartate ammonia-lyase
MVLCQARPLFYPDADKKATSYRTLEKVMKVPHSLLTRRHESGCDAQLLVEQGLTLVERPRLLTEPSYRRALLSRTRNAEVRRFFRERFERWGRYRAI